MEDSEQASLTRQVKGSMQRTIKSIKRTTGGIIQRSSAFGTITRWGVSKLSFFWHDPFHTLLNLPWGTFILVFFITYILQYIAFAFLYWIQGDCVIVQDGSNTFTMSLWMSSRVASTLGFTTIAPNRDCWFVNVCVMLQVIFSSLVNFILLGVVFARFSAPYKRSSTVRFSKVAVVSRHPSGFWALTMRVANLRKHQILQPSIRLMVTAADSITPSLYHHEQLNIEGGYKQLANLELGFPAHITHVITPDSFLYNLSLLEMDTRMMEVLVFVDGIDAMTSRYMSARCAYSTSDIYMNEQFAAINLEMRGKKLGLDFSDFDKTVPALDPALLLDLNDNNAGQDLKGEGGGLWQLRHQTFKRLAERYAHLGLSHTAVVAAAAAAGVNGDAHDQAGPSHSGGGEGMQKGLLGSTTPSHMPSGASIFKTTSGMPFAVTKASAQEEESIKLAALFGGKSGGGGPAGAWVTQHADPSLPPSAGISGGGEVPPAGTPAAAGGSSGATFVEMGTFQHGQGTAWQQSGIAMSPMPMLGSPPVGFANHDTNTNAGSGNTSPSNFSGRPGGNPFTSPLLANSNLYSLEEEGGSTTTTAAAGGTQQQQQQRAGGGGFPALPTSHNAASK